MGYRVGRGTGAGAEITTWQRAWGRAFAFAWLLSLSQCGSRVSNSGNAGGESGRAGSSSHGESGGAGGQSGDTGVSGHAGVGGPGSDAGAPPSMGEAGAGGAKTSSCAALSRCGGDPVGHWATMGQGGAASQPAGACADPELVPPAACSGFDYEPASSATPGIVNVVLPLPAKLAVLSADVKLNADHSYETQVEISGDSGLHLAPACLTAHGAHPTCADVESQLKTYLFTSPEYSHLTCPSAPDGGCACSWAFYADFYEDGSWQVAGAALSLAPSYQPPSGPLPPRVYDICENGDALMLSAHPEGSFIGNEVVGLRTLSLKRVQ